MQNYHKHSCWSNIFIADSAVFQKDYAERAIALGHKVLTSVEHGWQGRYHETYELAQKHGLKFVFGTEAYWVENRFDKDRTNCHIILLARNENGRRAINRILSEANETGYYFRPRIDVELLLTLPPNDVFVTSACVGFWHYDSVENIVEMLATHFKHNFYLEIQYHHTAKQVELNKRIRDLSNRKAIPMIVGMDSHYIFPEQAKERDYVLEAKGIQYGDEDGWFMDYPDDITTYSRFIEQGVMSVAEINAAMKATDLLLDFEDIAFADDIKLPTLYPGFTLDEKNTLYGKLVSSKFKEYTQGMPTDERQLYFDETKKEVQTIKNTGMADYFLIDHEIVKEAERRGGIITNSGRGSGVGYFTNTLLGFSKVDRIKSPVTLYPERFISESRILETRSLPDLDLNTGNPEVFAEAQEHVLGKGHVYPMIAFGTFKTKSAFKLYAKAKNLDFTIANTISQQLEKYEAALKYADDDERDTVNIYDYVDEKYHELLDQSKIYQGVISDKKKAPCAYLLYQGNIKEEIGLIKCKSDSTKKEYITTVIDGAIAEQYKFLKNDLLKVDVVLLIHAVYKRIGLESHTVNELMELIKNDKAVWEIYSKGLTVGVNQVERASTTQKVMRYKPKNISELCAFIAAIRPAFKSMYPIFESRKPFSYGIKAFDKIIQTEEFPQSFILYQEQTMMTLGYAGFPLDETYGIIKSIAKKHPEKVRPLKARFIEGFKKRIIADDGVSDSEAEKMSADVWQIINDSCGYGFNSAHAFCMALDSLYNAYLKAHYPHEFYEVLLQSYSDKGNKDKVRLLKQEMLDGFGIKEGAFRWGADNRKFVADKDKRVIYPSLLSIKGLSQKFANDLYNLAASKHYDHFYYLLNDLKNIRSGNVQKIRILIQIGYFVEFASISKIERFFDAYETLYGRSQFPKSGIDHMYSTYIKEFSQESEKQYRNFDYESALLKLWDDLDNSRLPLGTLLAYQQNHFGYIKAVIPDMSPDVVFVQGYECKYKNPVITLYYLKTGNTVTLKVKKALYDKHPFAVGNLLKITELADEPKWARDENGAFYMTGQTEIQLHKWNVMG